MRRFIRNIIVSLVLVATLSLGGCAKQGEPRSRRPKFQVVSIDKVTGSIGKSWTVTLTVANNTASNMRISSGSAYIRQDGRKVARVALDGEVFLPRRRCSTIDVPLGVTLSNPIAALTLMNRVRKGDLSGITVDYNVMISALASHRIFEQENVSFEELAQQFNLGLKK